MTAVVTLESDQTTYVIEPPFAVKALPTYFSLPSVERLRPQAGQWRALAEHYLAHRFDLLGSGWMELGYGRTCRGVEGHWYAPQPSPVFDSAGEWLAGQVNPANLAAAREIWREIEGDYRPIDWQLYYKSGFRRDARVPSPAIEIMGPVGTDIKEPWELTRMQWLPQLAYAYRLARAGHGGRPAENYAREFRNQLRDFWAANPPGYGADWVCCMDVSIRVVNWLVARDFFLSAGAALPEAFERQFARRIYEHGRFIYTRLEYSAGYHPDGSGGGNNHYLSDLVGLLFVSAYLPRTPETDLWLAFAVRELVRESDQHFAADGGNFEGSTSYHRLSGELLLYASALVLALPEAKLAALREYDSRLHAPDLQYRQFARRAPTPPEKLPPLAPAPVVSATLPDGRISPLPTGLLAKLERAAELSLRLARADGRIPQLGDNDSGRLLKLDVAYTRLSVAQARERYANLADYRELPDTAEYWLEDHLDMRPWFGAAAGLFVRPDFAAAAGEHGLAADCLNQLLAGRRLASLSGTRQAIAPVADDAAQPEAGAFFLESVFAAPAGADLRSGLEFYAYPGLGFYVWKSPALHLVVRCGLIGQHAGGLKGALG